MATNKKTDVKKSASEAAKEILAASEKKVEEAKVEVKKAQAKASETKAKATAAKKSATTTAKKTTTAAKKKVAAAKGEVVRTSILQYDGADYKIDDIMAKAEADFLAENKKKAIKEIKVYIKPQDNKAYYVVNGDYAGAVDL